MIRTLYVIACTGSLLLFAIHGFMGIDPFGSSDRTEIPANVRQSPGGYRSFLYWHSGYQGGK